MTPPLCILQARLGSTRLPHKMLLTLCNETLIARGWRMACETFGAENCVVAIPASITQIPLESELRHIGARYVAWDGAEHDVLGRFHHVAHRFRWHPDSIIVRWTSDDAWKDKACCWRVVHGERLPAELGAEAFTLGMLDAAYHREDHPHRREHITYALFGSLPPAAPPGLSTIDTAADYAAACALENAA
jgi:spore coat polysaccharide biosynthesis protein SpsF